MHVWCNGEQYQFEDGEIDTLFALSERVESLSRRWWVLEMYGALKATY